jgi:hypothetical protein
MKARMESWFLARRRPGLPRFTALLLIVALGGAGFGRAHADPAPPSVAKRRPPRLEDSPGWYPVVDPESSAVTIGRRVDAPLVQRPLHGGARTLDDLGRAVCRALHHADRDSLLELCVRDDEFRDILWREFPQSRPITGLTWEDGWISLDQRLRSGTSGAVGDFGGDDWRFVRFERDSIARFRNFRLHLGLRLVAVDDEGHTVTMFWLRSVVERKGRFKIYSTDD